MGKAELAGANEVAPGEGNLLTADHLGKETNVGVAVVKGLQAGLGVQSKKGPCRRLVAWESDMHSKGLLG